MSPKISFLLLASLTFTFLAGSSAPTPLYALYQAQWGFSPITTTVIFGIYALAVLATLFTVGSLSDHTGRRPVLLTALGLQAFAMVLFENAHSVNGLIAARVIQGLSAGAAMGAIGAGLIDVDKQNGTLANTIAPMLGTGSGGVISGLFVSLLPGPTHTVYLFFLALFVVQAIGVYLMPEPGARRPGALASLKPHLSVPASVRPAMLIAVPLLVSEWALVGFYGSLGPALIRRLSDSVGVMGGGLALFALGATGALAVYLIRAQSPRVFMLLGGAGLVAGVSLSLIGVSTHSVVVFFLGSAVSGIGFGAGFQGAIRTVVPQVEPGQRAGVLSVIFLTSYLSMGLPAVLAGMRVVASHGDVIGTAREFGTVVIALALIALGGTLLRDPSRRRMVAAEHVSVLE